MTIPAGTLFIGFSPTVNFTERKSTRLNDEQAVYTVEEIVGASGLTPKTYWFTGVTTSVQHDDFISTAESPKVIYQFFVDSAGTDMVGAGLVTYTDTTGTFTFPDVGGQSVRVTYYPNYELV